MPRSIVVESNSITACFSLFFSLWFSLSKVVQLVTASVVFSGVFCEASTATQRRNVMVQAANFFIMGFCFLFDVTKLGCFVQWWYVDSVKKGDYCLKKRVVWLFFV